jgi:copper chaperone
VDQDYLDRAVSAPISTSAGSTSQRASLELEIQGMHCAACVRRLTNALGQVHGVTIGKVEVGGASLTYDASTLSPALIADAVNSIGFVVVEQAGS